MFLLTYLESNNGNDCDKPIYVPCEISDNMSPAE